MSISHGTSASDAKSLLQSHEPRYRYVSRLVGYWLLCAATLGLQYAYGALFVQFLELLGGSRALAALVGSLCIGFQQLFSPVVVMLCARYGTRRITMIGGLSIAAGLAGSGCATRLWHLLFTYSLVVGIGCSMALYPAILLANTAFKRSMARAHAVANTGSAFGTITIGPIAPWLFEAFGLRRALLLLASFGLVFVGTGALCLLPLPRHTTRDAPATWQSTCSMLRDSRVLTLSCATLMASAGSWIPIVHIVRLAMDRNLAEAEAAHLLVFIAIGNGLGRLPTATLADLFGRRRVWACAVLSYAMLALLAAPHVAYSSSRAFLAIFAFFAGWLAGGLNTVMPTLSSEVLPPHRCAQATPLIMAPSGVGFVLGPAAAGWVVDVHGSYAAALVSAAACLATGASLCGLSICRHHVVSGAARVDTATSSQSGLATADATMVEIER